MPPDWYELALYDEGSRVNHGRLDLGLDLADTSGGSVDGTSGGGWSVVARVAVSVGMSVWPAHAQ